MQLQFSTNLAYNYHLTALTSVLSLVFFFIWNNLYSSYVISDRIHGFLKNPFSMYVYILSDFSSSAL